MVILLLFAAAAAANHFQNRVFNVSGGWMADGSKSTMKKHTLYKLNDRTDFNILYTRQTFFAFFSIAHSVVVVRSRQSFVFDRLWR